MSTSPFYLVSPAGRVTTYRTQPADLDAATAAAVYRDDQLTFNPQRYYVDLQKKADEQGFKEQQKFMGDKAWAAGKPPARPRPAKARFQPRRAA